MTEANAIPAPRPPRLSLTEMTELVLPQHANAYGAIMTRLGRVGT